MKRTICSVAVICGALTGCVTPEQAAMAYNSQQPATPHMKKEVVAYAKKTYFDPYSMRDVEISYAMTPAGPAVSGVCLRANAKNRMGAYTGLTATSLLFRNGTIASAWQGDPACNDPRLKYERFTQLEAA